MSYSVVQIGSTPQPLFSRVDVADYFSGRPSSSVAKKIEACFIFRWPAGAP